MDYPAKVSISLTYLFLAGGSIASIWKNAAKKSPKTGKSYVKMDLILLTLPTMSSGALYGVPLYKYIGCVPKLLFRNNDNISLHLLVLVLDLRFM